MLTKKEQERFLKIYIRLLEALQQKELSTREKKLVEGAEALLRKDTRKQRI